MEQSKRIRPQCIEEGCTSNKAENCEHCWKHANPKEKIESGNKCKDPKCECIKATGCGQSCWGHADLIDKIASRNKCKSPGCESKKFVKCKRCWGHATLKEKKATGHKCKVANCGRQKKKGCNGYCRGCFGQDTENQDTLENIQEEEYLIREALNQALKDATISRRELQYDRESIDQPDFSEKLNDLIEKEDAAFTRTLKGRRQLSIGEINGIASFPQVREVAAVYNNEIHTNIRDNSTYMKVLPLVKELAPSIHASSDREKQIFKSRVRHHCSFDSDDHTLTNDAKVWILWIQISKYTINDGIRQLISFICCVQEARRRGRNIEIYPIICIAPEYSRHDSPYQNPALHQLLQILCDPYLEGRRVFVVASDSTRFAFHPDDIDH